MILTRYCRQPCVVRTFFPYYSASKKICGCALCLGRCNLHLLDGRVSQTNRIALILNKTLRSSTVQIQSPGAGIDVDNGANGDLKSARVM